MTNYLCRISLLVLLCQITNSGLSHAQIKSVKTLAGDIVPLDGQGLKSLFLGPWQIKTRDSLAFIADKDYNALRQLNVKRRQIKTILTGQTAIAGIAISRTGDSIFFSTNGNMINLYRRSTQQLTVLDTLPDGEIDALECKRNGFLLIGSGAGHRIIQRDGQGNYKVIAGKLGVSGFLDGLDTLARFNRIASLLLSKTEDTLYIADRFNSRIRRMILSTRQVSTLPVTVLFGPRQLEFTKGKDSLLVANSSGHTIYRHSLKTNTGAQWCGLSMTSGYIDGAPATSRFNFPMGIARCDSGWLVCDNTNRRIRLITPGGSVKTFAGVGNIGDGQGINSRFSTPYDVVKHPLKDTLFITDQNNHAIRMMDLRTLNVSTLAGNGTSGNVYGIGSAVRLNRPSNMAINRNGDSLFFVEPFANKVKLLLTKTGEVKWLAGSDTSGYVDKTNGKFARFNRPQDLSFKDGFLYVADANNHKIRKIDVRTTAVTTFAGSTSGFKDSTLLLTRFNRPSTLEWVDNRLFVGEDAGLRIRVVIPDSNRVRNWAGSGNIGTVDGYGSAARFKGIFKLSHDPVEKRLLVAGYLNEGICRFVNTTTPVVGTFVNAAGFSDGLFSTARFMGPLGFWVDTVKKRYIMTDANNQRIREIIWYSNSAPRCVFDTATVQTFEDQGQVTFSNVIFAPTAGTGPGDSLQTFSFQFSSSPEGKISNPTFVNNRNLSLSTVPDSSGLVTLRIRMKDNGGTSFRGVDTTIYFKKIRIREVNDAPVILISGNDTAWNSAPRIKSGFIFSKKPGPSSESLQTMTLSIQVENPGLFQVLPFLENDALKFTPQPSAIGTTQAYLVCRDNGGTANGGVDSLIVPFLITIADEVSVKETLRSSWKVFPNPTKGEFRITNLPPGSSKIEFFNTMGSKVAEIPVNFKDQTFQVPSGLKGFYFLRTDGQGFSPTPILIGKE